MGPEGLSVGSCQLSVANSIAQRAEGMEHKTKKPEFRSQETADR